jgi:hypothetical protein
VGTDPEWVIFPLFETDKKTSGMHPTSGLFRQNVWIAPDNGLFSPPMKTGILCHEPAWDNTAQ